MMRIMQSRIAEFQNVPDIAHTDNATSPCCLDVGRRAETCHLQLNQRSRQRVGEQDFALTIAYRLLQETWGRMMKALQIRFGDFVLTAVVISDVSNDSKDIDA